MTAASFEGVHEKIARSEHHFETLYDAFKGFIEQEPQPFGISIPYFDADSGYYVCKAIVTESPPIRLGVMLGDVIHNARSALDHLVWQLVITNGKIPTRNNAWPIVTNPNRWKSAAATRLKGLPTRQIRLIDQGQPYKAGRNARNTFPAMLQSLSNADKHQIVHPTLALMVDPGDEVVFSMKRGLGRIAGSEVRHGRRLSTAPTSSEPGLLGAPTRPRFGWKAEVPLRWHLASDRSRSLRSAESSNGSRARRAIYRPQRTRDDGREAIADSKADT